MKPVDVVVGTDKWKSGGDRYKATKLIVHGKYNQSERAFDIALIKG